MSTSHRCRAPHASKRADAPPWWMGLARQRSPHNVALRMRLRRPVGDMPHGADGVAANGDRLGSAFAGDEEVAWTHTGLEELCPEQSQDAVSTWMGIAGRAAVSEVRRAGLAEAVRHETSAFHSDV